MTAEASPTLDSQRISLLAEGLDAILDVLKSLPDDEARRRVLLAAGALLFEAVPLENP